MPEQTQPTVRTLIDLPDQAMPLFVLEVVEFIDQEGDRAFAFRFDGESHTSTALGLLEVVKYAMLRAGGIAGDDD